MLVAGYRHQFCLIYGSLIVSMSSVNIQSHVVILVIRFERAVKALLFQVWDNALNDIVLQILISHHNLPNSARTLACCLLYLSERGPAGRTGYPAAAGELLIVVAISAREGVCREEAVVWIHVKHGRGVVPFGGGRSRG